MLLFERMWALHGFENTLADLYLERERIEMLADRIVEFDLGIIHNIARLFPGQIHGLWFTDDWGTQQALMISPRLWQEFFKPRYQRIFDVVHEVGWHVWMHSDGQISSILEDLIEIGVDVIQLMQPRALGIEQIGQRFRGRICFESLCDIQNTLPLRGAKEIQAEARLLLEQWATPSGGFILTIDEYDAQDLAFSEKIQIMLEAFLEIDPWRKT